MARKLSDMDKNMKVRHLGDKQVTLTVSHVGIKREKKKTDVMIISGGDLPDDYEETAVLYWKEHGSKFPLMLNASNRETIIKTIGDSDKWANALIGKRVTLERMKHPTFGKEYVGIIRIDNPTPAKSANGETVNKKTGEVTDSATAYWGRADALGKRKEASDILAKHTSDGPAGKVIDWAGAIAELEPVGDLQPA